MNDKKLRVWRLFLCAMEEEALPIIQNYNLLNVDNSSIKYFNGIEKKAFGNYFYTISDKFRIYIDNMYHQVALIITGVGKVNAASATTYGINVFNPVEIINIGMCGSLKEIYKIGSVLLIKQVCQHDFYISIKNIQFDYLHEKIDLKIPNKKTVMEIEGEFTQGTLATGDIFIDSFRAKENLSNIADVVDMEGYAIARVCDIFNVKLRMFKIVSDKSENDSKEEFINALEIYKSKVKDILFRI